MKLQSAAKKYWNIPGTTPFYDPSQYQIELLETH